MSIDFVTSIDYEKGSATIEFTPNEEIKNTDESIDAFCDKLAYIVSHHSFVRKLDDRGYSRDDIEKIINACDEQITESIDRMDIFNASRDDISEDFA